MSVKSGAVFSWRPRMAVLNNYFFKGKYAYRHVGCLGIWAVQKRSSSKAAASFRVHVLEVRSALYGIC